MSVPDASMDYEGFIQIAQKKSIILGSHKHGFACEKPPKGLYMCRLSMGRGIFNHDTKPLIIALRKAGDRKIKKRAILDGLDLDIGTFKLLSNPYRPLNGNFIRPHPAGPVVWELKRPRHVRCLWRPT